ncbi:MAG: L-aspartate oxidase [Kineosporiaceae bacterium]
MSGPAAPAGVEVPADVVVVGSGVAGLTAALEAARLGLRVAVLTRTGIGAGSTEWAQGGLAAVTDVQPVPGDDLDLHVRDTLGAGAGLNEPDAVRDILGGAGAAVPALLARGARFDTAADGVWLRTREGGHSLARVIRAGGDATGAEVSRALVEDTRRNGLVVLEGFRVVALPVAADGPGGGRRVVGVTALGPDGSRLVLPAHAVVLATGGVGGLYARTTNPPEATGDGIALALRAGARVSDAEFVQFHPTALAVDAGADGNVPLVTEAVRGEGGVLRDGDGRALMDGVHPARDLAPRDVVALAIARHLDATGEPHVWLDARGIPDVTRRFPTVARACRESGIDLARDLVPVRPAAHYHCGGVRTDLQGWTGVRGLYAVGEVARTGLHGANRLASNSLVEGLVMGGRSARALAGPRVGPAEDLAVVEAALSAADPAAGRPAAARSGSGGADPLDPERIRALMDAHVGIAREGQGLRSAAEALTGPVRDGAEGTGLMRLAAAAIVAAALDREESRGCHQRTDRPDGDPSRRGSTHWCLPDPDGDALVRCAPAAPDRGLPLQAGGVR